MTELEERCTMISIQKQLKGEHSFCKIFIQYKIMINQKRNTKNKKNKKYFPKKKYYIRKSRARKPYL